MTAKASDSVTLQAVFSHLVDIGKIKAGSRATLLDGDLIYQDQLFEVQEKLGKLLVDMANVLPNGGQVLQKTWPQLFHRG